MGGNNDLMIVAIALILVFTYSTWLFLFSTEQTNIPESTKIPSQNYTSPDSSGFFGQVQKASDLSVSQPEIFFLNTILFGTIGFLLVMVGLRFFRGQG